MGCPSEEADAVSRTPHPACDSEFRPQGPGWDDGSQNLIVEMRTKPSLLHVIYP